eukprot:6172865-Pleurochrysis_carterae.AAC.1
MECRCYFCSLSRTSGPHSPVIRIPAQPGDGFSDLHFGLQPAAHRQIADTISVSIEISARASIALEAPGVGPDTASCESRPAQPANLIG